MNRVAVIFASFLAVTKLFAQSPTPAPTQAMILETHGAKNSSTSVLPSDAEIRKILADRVEALAGPEDGIGIVVGVIWPKGRQIISRGHFDQKDQRAMAGDTVCEIASVTKGFTGLLLADMVQDGEVALSDPVAKYLPANVKIPERNGRSITLVDLATHTSGLPFMPTDGAASSDADLYKFLAGYKLTRDIGAQWEYSNIGYWLLSQALSARAGLDYQSLLLKRVVGPLKLKNTAFTPSASMKANLAAGHTASLQPAPLFPSLPGYAIMPAAGGLYSTVDDLLTVAAVAMGYQESPLAPAIAASLKTHRPMPKPGMEQALGWIVIDNGEDQLIFHDGGSFGYASAVIWDPAKRIGIAVLSNHVESVADIARHLLRPDFPLKKPTATKHTEISLGADVLERYAGRYDATGEGTFTIKLEENCLTIEAPAEWGMPKVRLHPETKQDFFANELPLRVTFQNDSAGNISGMLIYPPRGQKAVPANKVRE